MLSPSNSVKVKFIPRSWTEIKVFSRQCRQLVVMDPPAQGADQAWDAWLSREPILTKEEQVVGYELLCRQNLSDGTRNEPDAPCDVIDTLNLLGLEALCDGRLAFIKSTQDVAGEPDLSLRGF